MDRGGRRGDDTIVVVGRRGGGLAALDPRTGATRWQEAGGVGAWTFRTAVLTLSCARSGECVLALRALADGAVQWRTGGSGLDRALTGANPAVLGARTVARTAAAATVALPGTLPDTIGLAVENRVEVLDLGAGTRLTPMTPHADTKVAVLGGQVVVTTARPSGDHCAYTVEAHAPGTGALRWRRTDVDPHTVVGTGCAQRRAPTGAGGVLAVTRDDGREVLLSVPDGREIWVGAPDESVRAIDERYALVRSADGKLVHAVRTATGAVRWSQPLPARAGFVVCPAAVVIRDEELGIIAAYHPDTGTKLLQSRVLGEVLGCGDAGLVLARGRTIGYLRW